MSEGLIEQTPGGTASPGLPNFGLCRKVHRCLQTDSRVQEGAGDREMIEQLDLIIAGVGR